MSIEMRGVCKSFGKKQALADLSLTVGKGEVYGLIGPNGAGKTTAMSIMVGLTGPDSGHCSVLGRAPRSKGPAERSRVGFLPEEPVFPEGLSALECLEFLGGCMGGSHGRAELLGLLGRVGLAQDAKRRATGFSRGMRQRLGLACALLGDPEVLILDEPSSALDPEGRRAVLDLIGALKDSGRTVLLSTHILSDVERACDRIGLIDSGRLILEGAMDDVLDGGLGLALELSFSRPLEAAEVRALGELPSVESIDARGAECELCFRPQADREAARAELLRAMAGLSLPLASLNAKKRGLEELFLAKAGRHA
jgi:ABC-2 type transport system ATP-binding protein